MVARMMDEDDTVKELAIKTIEELWFPTASTTTVNTRTKSASAGHHQSDKNSILAKVIVIMGTAAHFKERQSPLEDLLHKIMAEKPENEVPALHARYSEICETLIDGLVDATDMPGFVSPTLCRQFRLTAGLKDGCQLHTDYLFVHFGISASALRFKRVDIAPVPQKYFNGE